jgi:hypothetical protein
VSANVPTIVNDYSPIGYSATATNRLILTPAAGNSTINGLDSTGVVDGYAITIWNPSTTDSLIFANQSVSSTPGNLFACPQLANNWLPPQTGATIKYCINQWIFT